MFEKGLIPYIPLLEGEHLTSTELEDFGDGNYVVQFLGAVEADYKNYLSALAASGFEKYADNGDGVGGTVFTATFTKGLWQVTVLYLAKPGKIFVSFSFGKKLSPRMLRESANSTDAIPGAKTRLHMIELFWFGNSFIIQLKNGHFIVYDGGRRVDAPYLVDYLESLAPQGEKPVVEAWLVSHAHSDHCGALCQLSGDLSERIFVEGIYYSIAGDVLYKKAQATRVDTAGMLLSSKRLKTSDGKTTRFYRPQTGQKYYFSDIVIEVVHTQDQLLREVATNDINDTSTWFMLHIEGQKCLLTGDGERGCMTTLMENYTPEYLDVDMMTLMHHGYNTMDVFTDYCKVKTLLQTVNYMTPVRQANENNYLRSKVEEYFNWGDGTKVLAFPYTVGSYESLPPKKWIYNAGEERKEQPNIHRYWKGHYKKEIRGIRIADNGFVKAGAYLYDRIQEHLPVPTAEDGVRITLRIQPDLKAANGYLAIVEDPIGWVITAKSEEKLLEAIKRFTEDAAWTDRGFTPVRVEE